MANLLRTIQAVQAALSEGGWPHVSILDDLARFEDTGAELWVSRVDPCDLKVPELRVIGSQIRAGELLPAASFLRFFGLEPNFSLTFNKLAAPRCPECKALASRRSKEDFLEGLKSRDSGFMVISLKVTDENLRQMSVGVALDVVGSRSLIIDNKRVSGGELDKIIGRASSEFDNISFILNINY